MRLWGQRLPTPSQDTPWRRAEFCVLDLETTGLSLGRDEIVSYGAAIVAHARIPCGRLVYRQVRPRLPISVPSMTVHGLRAVDLADAPPLDEVLDELIGLLSGRVLVAHAAWVEQAFLNRALRGRRVRLGRAVVDTAALIRACGLADSSIGGEPDIEKVSARLGLPVHTPHHALGDAFTTAQLFLALATRLERSGPLTVRDLLSVSRHYRA